MPFDPPQAWPPIVTPHLLKEGRASYIIFEIPCPKKEKNSKERANNVLIYPGENNHLEVAPGSTPCKQPAVPPMAQKFLDKMKQAALLAQTLKFVEAMWPGSSSGTR